jgi:hypothetical protein
VSGAAGSHAAVGSRGFEGFFGCVDPRPPAPKPVMENEPANAMKAERQTSAYTNHNYQRELDDIEQSEGRLSNARSATRATYRVTRTL